ncbi:MAG: translation initiation factor IF-3 [Granulosicoccaceae bacterium]
MGGIGISAKVNRKNEEIDVPEVRLIGADGEQVGLVSLEVARAQALESALDLVEISPNAEPPVCKIMDHGRFKFENNKKQHSAKKKQKTVQIKEIKFRPGTEDGDYQVKLRNLIKFLENGDKTKITLRFRGREMAHRELGAQLLKRVEADLTELAVVEQFPKLEGRQMVMVMAPRKNLPAK